MKIIFIQKSLKVVIDERNVELSLLDSSISITFSFQVVILFIFLDQILNIHGQIVIL